MRLQSRWARLALMFAVLALLAVGCRGDEAADDAQDAVDDAVSDAEDTAEEAEETVDDAADEAEETADDAMEEDATEDDAAAAGDVAFDVGVTEEACPDAVNADNGCIYLGTISDLTVGPFAALAVPITDAQTAFWQRVNENGGVGGFDVNTSEFTRDNQYSPEVHSQQYEEIKNEVLALAQSLGSPTTFAILDDLEANNVITAPASWTSAWLFSDVIVESGNTYCVESQNGLDYLTEQAEVGTVMAVHYPGDYGDDGAAGARVWAEVNGAEFVDVPTTPGQDNQGEAVNQVVSGGADVVVITTGPSDAGTIVGQAAAGGFQGRFLFNSPSFNPGLLQSPAAPAVIAQVTVAGPWEPFQTDTPGHQAMREALGDVTGNDGYTSGWAWSYPLLAVLEQAAANGDLTREGMATALSEITEVDYEGMVPAGAGNLSGDANAAAVRATSIGTPSDAVPSGLESQGFYEGETAAAFEFSAPCYESGE
ncbi:ABC transporter substrate-binding protein [Euzebya pacifica]|nr:ABC transporter substrate-binding protein [Euzebya pacifica]